MIDRATRQGHLVEEVRRRCAQPVRAVVQPEDRPRVSADHRASRRRTPTATRPRTPARARCVAWDPVKQRAVWAHADAGCIQRRRARRPRAISSSRVRPTATSPAYSTEGRRRVGVLFRDGRARCTDQLCDRQAPVHLDPQRPDAGYIRQPRRSCRRDSAGTPACIRAGCSPSCSMATAHLPATPDPRSRSPSTGRTSTSTRPSSRRAPSSSRNASGVTAPARSPVVARPICVPPRCRSARRRSRRSCAAGVETRGMPKFEELSDRELEALRHYIRRARPEGDAPRWRGASHARSARARHPKSPSKSPPNGCRPPGSLESQSRPPPKP